MPNLALNVRVRDPTNTAVLFRKFLGDRYNCLPVTVVT